MNRIYRIVFNRTLGVPQVVSELAKAPGGSVVGESAPLHSVSLRARLLAAAVGLALASFALPVLAQTGAPGSTGVTGDDGISRNRTWDFSELIDGGDGSVGGVGESGGTGLALDGMASFAGTALGGTGGAGGQGGKGGNAGIHVSGNWNYIDYGNVGQGGIGGSGAQGGAGISGQNFIASISGTVTGGVGGVGGLGGAAGHWWGGSDSDYGPLAQSGNGGQGGAGVSGGNFTLINSGSIVGGAGGASAIAGAGGVGISGNDFSVINIGTISGGLAGGNGAQADAILFSGSNNSLALQTGSIINGDIELAAGAAATIASKNSGLVLTNSIKLDSDTSALTVDTSASNLIITGVISGAGSLTQSGTSGVATLAGVNSYVGVTTVSTGTLALIGSGSIASSSGLIVDGVLDISGTYGTSITTLKGNGRVMLGGQTLTVTNAAGGEGVSFNNFFDGTISGDGAFHVAGGSEFLSNANTYTGGTIIDQGASLSIDGTGSIIGDVKNNGQLLFQSTANKTIDNLISGVGTVAEFTIGSDTLTAINTYSGTTAIYYGTLALSGNGSISNSRVDLYSDTAAFDISNAPRGASLLSAGGSGAIILGKNLLTLTNAGDAFQGVISGNGGGLQVTGGKETLNGANTYTGDTVVQGGTLVIGDSTHTTASVYGNVSVQAGAVLAGDGTIGNSVNIASGAHLDPGADGLIGSLTVIGNLTVEQGGIIDAALGAPTTLATPTGTGDHINVFGNLTLAGATLNITAGADFGAGVYRLFDYGGTLIQTNGGIVLGIEPANTVFAIQTNIDHQINLVSAPGSLTFWNGNGFASSSAMGGGSGTWTAAAPNWTNLAGDFEGSIQPHPGVAVFGGVAGVLTIDNADGQIGATGLQFASTGYEMDGGTLTLAPGVGGGAPVIRVGDGDPNRASDVATITNTLAGKAGLNKSDYGTLVLTGTNVYTGGTTISVGTLQLGNGGTAGSILGDVADNGALMFDHTNDLIFSGAISGTGSLTQAGTGVLTLSNGITSYSGLTTISAGTLALASGTSIAASSGVVDNGTFDITGTSGGASIQSLSGASRGTVALGNQVLTLTNAAGTFDGVIADGGILAASGGGIALTGGNETLTGTNTYTGDTLIYGGTLALSGVGSVASSSRILLSDGTFDISGTTSGASIQSLVGLNAAGTVALGAKTLTFAGASADLPNNLSSIVNGVIADGGLSGGVGGGITVASGAVGLAGINTYTGLTTINADGLLALGNAGSIATSSGVIANGGFDISYTTAGASIQTLSGLGQVSLGGQTLTLNQASGTFDGVMADGGINGGTGGSVTLNSGKEVLTGTNTYTGDTTISGGVLALTGTGSIASSNVVNNSTFDISGTTNGAAIQSLQDTVIAAGQVALGGKTLTLTQAAGSFDGVIADGGLSGGTGGRVTLLSGDEALGGINTYTGATTISGGLLILEGDGSIAASSGLVNDGTFDISYANQGASIRTLSDTGAHGVVSLGAQTLTLTDASSKYDGVIADAAMLPGSGGGLTLLSGQEILTGANTYSGATTIRGGTLALSGTGSIATSNAVIDNGTFDISGTTVGASIQTLSGTGAVALGASALTLTKAADTFAGVIAGSGGLLVNGGTETLTGNNTYTGGTTLSGSTVQLGNGGTSGSILGDVLNNGALAFDRSDDLSFAGVISGTGSVVQSAASRLSLTGNNTYSGGTALNAGTLVLGNASSIGSGTLAMAEGTALDVSRSFTLANAITLSGDPTVNVGSGLSATLSGGISDGAQSGDLVKTGSGTLVLTGTNTYTGSTTAAAGTLDVEGTLASAVSVASGATLVGSGMTGGLTVGSGGRVSPGGNAIGTLTVSGNLSLAGGSSYQLDATDTGRSDRIVAAGSATLGGGSVIAMEAGNNWNASTRYTILTAAGGVSGTFGPTSNNFAFLTPTLSYDANDAYLSLVRNAVAFPTVGVTPNEVQTGGAIEALGAGNAVYNAVLPLAAAPARAAFANLAGNSLASARTAIIDDSHYVRDAINTHLQGVQGAGEIAQNDEDGSVWTSTWGHGGSHDGDANAPEQSSTGSGVLVGVDRDLDTLRLGAVAGSGQLSSNGTGAAADAHSSDTVFGVYGGLDLGAWQLQGGATHSWYQTHTHRQIDVPTLAGYATASSNSGVTQAYADGGYQFSFGMSSLTPYVDLARVWVHQDAIEEGGNAAALDVQANGTAVNYGTAGVRGIFQPSAGLQLHASVGYQHAWGDLRSIDQQRFSNGGTESFSVAGLPVSKNAGAVDLGIRFALSQNVSVDGTYHGQFADDATDQGARMSLNVAF